MQATFTMYVTPGKSIDAAAAEAQKAADILDKTVMFEFNSVECFAIPGGDWAELAREQQEEQNRKPRAFSDGRSAR